MSLSEALSLAVAGLIDPEKTHALALRALQVGLVALPGPVTSPRLATRLCGLSMPNPVGLAAGFDKNATAVSALMRAGFGFLEVGAATPRPQPGNPRPRLFRLARDRAAINRFGFNNDGIEVIATRLAGHPQGIPVGLNLGANKDSPDRAADFVAVLARGAATVDFATINVSSPNTEKLRDLQGKAALETLLSDVVRARDALARRIPLFLKIAPDLSDDELTDIAEVVAASGIDAVIATNTTIARDGLRSRHRHEAGGLSGAPLFDRSTRVLARLSVLTEGRLPLIGVGGISTANDAYQKIRAGASAVQLYTAMVFDGLSLAPRIARQLDDLLARDGFDTVADAVGTDRRRWL